eukprot:TRINITY_DN1625_c0_g1_i1.p1 TRINITY_DN1625_c0_g1~~TRINITY_DN1625_c0_g1_i1.p1  ORF type:complete len:2034 (+),score=766.38 TRINITY_DN1625_c0_g1_i1:407-6103(+)
MKRQRKPILGLTWILVRHFSFEEHLQDDDLLLWCRNVLEVSLGSQTLPSPHRTIQVQPHGSPSGESEKEMNESGQSESKEKEKEPVDGEEGEQEEEEEEEDDDELSYYRMSIRKMKDFRSSWVDGTCFCALIHTQDKSLFSLKECFERVTNMGKDGMRENLTLAFSCALEKLGIPSLLEVDDVLSDRPDEKSILTYVSTLQSHIRFRMRNKLMLRWKLWEEMVRSHTHVFSVTDIEDNLESVDACWKILKRFKSSDRIGLLHTRLELELDWFLKASVLVGKDGKRDGRPAGILRTHDTDDTIDGDDADNGLLRHSPPLKSMKSSRRFRDFEWSWDPQTSDESKHFFGIRWATRVAVAMDSVWNNLETAEEEFALALHKAFRMQVRRSVATESETIQSERMKLEREKGDLLSEKLDLEESRRELSDILGVLEANEEKLRRKFGDLESSDSILERVISEHAEFSTKNATLEHTLQEYVEEVEKLKEMLENERSEFARVKEDLSEELKVSNTLSAQMEEDKNDLIRKIEKSWEEKLLKRDAELKQLHEECDAINQQLSESKEMSHSFCSDAERLSKELQLLRIDHETCKTDLVHQKEESEGIQSRLMEEIEQTRKVLKSQEERISELGNDLVIANQELEEQKQFMENGERVQSIATKNFKSSQRELRKIQKSLKRVESMYAEEHEKAERCSKELELKVAECSSLIEKVESLEKIQVENQSQIVTLSLQVKDMQFQLKERQTVVGNMLSRMDSNDRRIAQERQRSRRLERNLELYHEKCVSMQEKEKEHLSKLHSTTEELVEVNFALKRRERDLKLEREKSSKFEQENIILREEIVSLREDIEAQDESFATQLAAMKEELIEKDQLLETGNQMKGIMTISLDRLSKKNGKLKELVKKLKAGLSNAEGERERLRMKMEDSEVHYAKHLSELEKKLEETESRCVLTIEESEAKAASLQESAKNRLDEEIEQREKNWKERWLQRESEFDELKKELETKILAERTTTSSSMREKEEEWKAQLLKEREEFSKKLEDLESILDRERREGEHEAARVGRKWEDELKEREKEFSEKLAQMEELHAMKVGDLESSLESEIANAAAKIEILKREWEEDMKMKEEEFCQREETLKKESMHNLNELKSLMELEKENAAVALESEREKWAHEIEMKQAECADDMAEQEEKYRSALASKDEEISSRAKEIKRLEAKCSALEASLKENMSSLEEKSLRLEQRNQDHQRACAELEKKEAEILRERGELEQSRTELSELLLRMEKIDQALSESNASLFNKETALEEILSEHEETTRTCERMQQMLGDKTSECEDLIAQKDELEVKLHLSQQSESEWSEKCRGLEDRIEHLEEEKKAAKLIIGSLEDEMKEDKDTIDSLSQKLLDAESDREETHMALEATIDHRKRTDEELEKVTARLTELEESLKEKQLSLDEEQEENNQLRDELEERMGEIETLKRDMFSLNESAAETSSALESAAKENEMLGGQVDELKRSVITMEGEMETVREEASAREGCMLLEKESLASQVEVLEGELEEAKGYFAEQKEEWSGREYVFVQSLAEMKENQMKLDDMLSNMQEEIFEKEGRIKELESTVEQMGETIASLRAQLETKEIECLGEQTELQLVKREMTEVISQMEESESRLARANQRLQQKEDALSRVLEEHTIFKKTIAEQRDALESKEIAVVTLQKEMQKVNEAVQSQLNDAQVAWDEVARLRKMSEQQEERAERLQKRLSEKERELLGVFGDGSSRVHKLEAAERELESCKRRLAQRDDEVASLVEQVEALRGDSVRVDEPGDSGENENMGVFLSLMHQTATDLALLHKLIPMSMLSEPNAKLDRSFFAAKLELSKLNVDFEKSPSGAYAALYGVMKRVLERTSSAVDQISSVLSAHAHPDPGNA